MCLHIHPLNWRFAVYYCSTFKACTFSTHHQWKMLMFKFKLIHHEMTYELRAWLFCVNRLFKSIYQSLSSDSPLTHPPFWTKWHYYHDYLFSLLRLHFHTRARRSSALWKGWDVITFRLCFICPFLFGIFNHVSPLLFSFFLCQLICIILISVSLSVTLSLLYWERERERGGKRGKKHEPNEVNRVCLSVFFVLHILLF